MNGDVQSRPAGPGALGYLAAALLAIPIGAVVWFELGYLYFGVMGEDAPDVLGYVGGAIAFGLAFGIPLYGSRRPAEVVRQACHLGLVTALLLPFVTVAVLLLQQNEPAQREAGMGGLILYGLPVMAAGVAAVLSVAYVIGSWAARRRLAPKKEKATAP